MSGKRPLCNYAGSVKEMVAGDVVAGHDTYHGVESIGAISFDPATKVLSVASVTYWYKGVQYVVATPTTCDLDLTTDRDHASATLTANTLYFIYFKDVTGKLYWSPSFWDLRETVPVATVFWNGSAGAVSKESHGYSRNIDWHIWAHLTVGARYGAGLDKTSPTTASDGSLQIESGTIYDEDLAISIGKQTTMRGYYKASAGVYTFADYALPYLGTSGAPVYLDTDTYALTTFASNKYICYWVFATTDQDRPIAIIPSHVSAAYTTATLARAEVAPSIAGVNPEWKLIYRWIYFGDGQLQEFADYRLQTSIAGGVSASTTAGAVAFTPAGNVSSTNVQSAIEELDASIGTGTNIGLFDIDVDGDLQPSTDTNTDEFFEVDVNGGLMPKAAAGETPDSRYYGAVFDGGGAAIAADKKVYVRVPVSGTIVGAYIMADISGTISVEVWKDTFANFPPTVTDKISASAPIALSSAQKGEDTTLTGWTKTVAAGDVICFNVSALATSITWCAVGVVIQ